MFSRLRSLWRGLWNRSQQESDLDDEVRFHIETRAEDLMRGGLLREEALRHARLEFGALEKAKVDCRESHRVNWAEDFLQDLLFATRMLRKSPGFTLVAVLTLALGIGANTAIFSLIDTVMLRFLPVQRPEELVQIGIATPKFGDGQRTSYTNPLWEEFRDHQDSFSGVFAWGGTRFNLAQTGVADNVRGVFVSGSYFETLGVRPATGRLLAPEDDKRGCSGVAVLSYGFWQDHFGGAPSAIGNTIRLDGHPFQIIGVSARGFFGTEVGSRFDVAAPICSEAIIVGKSSALDKTIDWWLHVMGRPKSGVSTDQITARLAVISPQIFAAAVPNKWNAYQQASFRTWRFVALPGGTGISNLRRDYDLPLRMLMAIAALVLLIACANIAGLTLARASARRKEISVRLALGASRMRLARQLLTESMSLSGLGALLGVFVARAGSRLLVSYISTEQDRVFLDLALDGRVLFFTAATAILSGLLFGVLPALRATRVSLAGGMKGEARELSSRGAPFRSGRWIVAAQVATSMVLVIAAGLLVRSFVKLATLEAGFDRTNVLVVEMGMHNTNLTPADQGVLAGEILRRIRALPGVVNAAESIITPLDHSTWDDEIMVEGKNVPSGEDADVYLNVVTPNFFATLRTPLIEGRDFDERDAAEIPRVAIINKSMARKFFPSVDPLGKTIRRFATATTLSAPIEIVGIVSDAKYGSLREDFQPIAYFPFAEIPTITETSDLLIRTTTPPAAIESSVQGTILDVNKSIAIEFRPLAQQVGDSIAQERMLATLSGFFGGLALLLAMIGLYGLLAYLVLERQKEIGIRIALGAQRGAILRLVMSDVGRLLFAGIAAGIAIAWATTRFMQSLLFGLQAHDAGTIVLAAGLLATVALGAAYLPARRAMRVDPMVALRHE